MIASKIRNSAAAVAGFWILDFGTKGVMVASKIQKLKNSAAAAAEIWILSSCIKELWLLKT